MDLIQDNLLRIKATTKSKMKKLKIFLASSEELKDERLELADFIEHLNHTLYKLDMNVQLVKWEYIDSSMGVQHKQEDYNDALKECEMCIVIYWRNFGMYTKTELDTAYARLKKGSNPKKLYVYFKDTEGEEEITEELKEFRDSFPEEYGHFANRFRNIDTLKSQFLLQFIEYKSNDLKGSPLIEVRDGKIVMGGKTYIDLMNVPFVGNNEEYTSLLKNIKKTKKLLASPDLDEEEYKEYSEDLHNLEEKKEKMEGSLWDTALEITRLSNQKCSDRLQIAIDLFNKGDNKGANAILNEEEIYKDAEQNLNLIKLGEEGRKGLITNIEELKLKVKTLRNEMSPEGGDKIIALYEKIVDFTKTAYGEFSNEYIDVLIDLGRPFRELGKYWEAKSYQEKAYEIISNYEKKNEILQAKLLSNISWNYIRIGIYKNALPYAIESLNLNLKHKKQDDPDLAYSYNNVGVVYLLLEEYEKSLDYLIKALEIRKRVLGEDHYDTVGSYENIGVLYEHLNNYEKAVEYKIKALEIKKGGNNYYETIKSYDNIAFAYEKMGELNKSIEYSLEALEVRKKVNGEENSGMILQCRIIAGKYKKIGEKEKWSEYNSKALEIRKKIYGEKDYITKALEHLATSRDYMKKGEFENALAYSEKSLETGKKSPMEDKNTLARIYEQIGKIYYLMNKPENAMDYFLKVLDVRRKMSRTINRNLLKAINDVAWIYFEVGNYDEALQFGKELEYLMEGRLWISDRSASHCYDTLGSIYEGVKDYDKAFTYFTRAYEIDKAYYPQFAWIRIRRLAEHFLLRGDLVMAKENFEEALRLLPENHPDAIDTRKRLEELKNSGLKESEQ